MILIQPIDARQRSAGWLQRHAVSGILPQCWTPLIGRAGHFSWRLFWPFAVLAVPMAFLGGYLNLPTPLFTMLVGVVLVFSSVRFFWKPSDDHVTGKPSRPLSLATAAGLGLLAGLTGTGGGIFLTPLLLTARWASAKNAAAASALFILVNSSAGLLENLSSTQRFPVLAIALAFAAVVGGTAGSYFGSKRFDHTIINRLLAVVLMVAGLKLILAP